jgi:K+ transporter
MWAGAVVSLLSLVVGLSTMGSAKADIREELSKDDPNVSQSTIDAAYAIGVAVVVVAGALGVLLWLWMAWKNGQGRSWARIVATVLGCLNAVFMLLTFTAPSADATALAFSSINLALAITILVLLWRKESSDFYTARSRPQYG